MTAGRDLAAALAERAKGYRDRAPVFTVEPSEPRVSLQRARLALQFAWPFFGDCQPKFVDAVESSMARLLTPNDGRVNVFLPSGALAGVMRRDAAPISHDGKSKDHSALIKRAQSVAEGLAKEHVSADDQLRYETLFELNARGITVRGHQASEVALIEVVAAFRRYLHDLPVLGRASVHVGLNGKDEVTRWGIDWRTVTAKPVAEAHLVDAAEGAHRVMNEMAWRRPEKPFTPEDFHPASFTLGYMSAGRRAEQFVMQPVWVAVLRPARGMTMGHVVAVPAATKPFGPLAASRRVAGRRHVRDLLSS
jgi:hypothetical protein